MVYKTSLGIWAKIFTIVVTILFGFIVVEQYSIIEFDGQASPVLTSLLVLTVYFTALALRPLHYRISNDELIIHRLFRDVIIERQNIQRVEIIDKDMISWSIRTFGIDGLFGFFGNFANLKMGKMIWFATRKGRTVLVLTTDNRKIILTPDQPAKFVADYYG